MENLPTLDLLAIPFNRWSVTRYSSQGTPYVHRVSCGVPHLAQYKWVKEVVFFLYHTEEDARVGTKAGGTGFLIGVPSSRWGTKLIHVHAVTNWHNACARGATVIRINRHQGEPDIFEFGPEQWAFIPGGPDVAISPLLHLQRSIHAAGVVATASLLTTELERSDDIGEADDVFMVGRFVDYDGEKSNIPSFRFGNISIMDATIEQETGFKGRSIVIDMHSRTGYSGSPVFVYRTPGSFFPERDEFFTGNMMRVLGIHWGQFPDELNVLSRSEPGKKSSNFWKTDPQYVKGTSGMTCVVPAQAILDILLNNEDLKAMRESEEEKMKDKINDELRKRPIAETASKDQFASLAKDANPQHREDFTALVGEAARKRRQDD